MTSSDVERSKPRKDDVLVAGATGDLGGAITRILIAEGKPVRILARPSSRYQQLEKAGAEVVMGDLKNRTSLDPACRCINVLVTTANSVRRGGEDNLRTVDLDGNRNLIDAAKAAGVEQFIFVSAFGADPKSPVPVLQVKGKTEEYLRASGIPYTIIAPNAFMDWWIPMVVGKPVMCGRPVILVGRGERKHSFVSSTDVANLVAACVGNQKAIDQRFVIGGPESFSFRDAIAICERELKSKIPVELVAIGVPVPGFSEDQLNLLSGLEMFDSPIDIAGIVRDFGIKPTRLETFVRSMLAGATA